MRYGKELNITEDLRNAMGIDWKKKVAINSFGLICTHPEWDGQPVSFSFTEVKEDETLLGVRVDSWFDTKEN